MKHTPSARLRYTRSHHTGITACPSRPARAPVCQAAPSHQSDSKGSRSPTRAAPPPAAAQPRRHRGRSPCPHDHRWDPWKRRRADPSIPPSSKRSRAVSRLGAQPADSIRELLLPPPRRNPLRLLGWGWGSGDTSGAGWPRWCGGWGGGCAEEEGSHVGRGHAPDVLLPHPCNTATRRCERRNPARKGSSRALTPLPQRRDRVLRDNAQGHRCHG